jgi:hypothetical protein
MEPHDLETEAHGYTRSRSASQRGKRGMPPGARATFASLALRACAALAAAAIGFATPATAEGASSARSANPPELSLSIPVHTEDGHIWTP